MAIAFIGKAEGTVSATIPTHTTGDLILAFAYRSSTANTIIVPAGWTVINSGAANTNAHALVYRFATAPGTTSGSWSNTQSLLIHVYRGATGIGDALQLTGAGTEIVYPDFTLSVDDGSSWVAAFVGIRSAAQPAETAPPPLVNRSNGVITGGEAAGHDTAGPVTSLDPLTGGSSGGFRWRTATVEILGEPGDPPPGPTRRPSAYAFIG